MAVDRTVFQVIAIHEIYCCVIKTDFKCRKFSSEKNVLNAEFVLLLFKRFFFGTFYKIKDENTFESNILKKNWLQQVSDIILEYITAIKVDEDRRVALKLLLIQVVNQIKKILNILFKLDEGKYLIIKTFLCNIILTPRCTIDFKQTATLVVENSNIDNENKYKIASYFCLTENANYLYKEFSYKFKRKAVKRFSETRAFQLLKPWTRNTNSNKNICELKFNMSERGGDWLMFLEKCKTNDVAIQYIWERSTKEDLYFVTIAFSMLTSNKIIWYCTSQIFLDDRIEKLYMNSGYNLMKLLANNSRQNYFRLTDWQFRLISKIYFICFTRFLAPPWIVSASRNNLYDVYFNTFISKFIKLNESLLHLDSFYVFNFGYLLLINLVINGKFRNYILPLSEHILQFDSKMSFIFSLRIRILCWSFNASKRDSYNKYFGPFVLKYNVKMRESLFHSNNVQIIKLLIHVRKKNSAIALLNVGSVEEMRNIFNDFNVISKIGKDLILSNKTDIFDKFIRHILIGEEMIKFKKRFFDITNDEISSNLILSGNYVTLKRYVTLFCYLDVVSFCRSIPLQNRGRLILKLLLIGFRNPIQMKRKIDEILRWCLNFKHFEKSRWTTDDEVIKYRQALFDPRDNDHCSKVFLYLIKTFILKDEQNNLDNILAWAFSENETLINEALTQAKKFVICENNFLKF